MQNNGEQVEVSTSKIGKFDTAEELLAAYNALESEFTKRCQSLKRLQAELELLRAQAAEKEADAAADDIAAATGDGKESEACAQAVEAREAAQPFDPDTLTRDEILRAVSDTVLGNARDYADALSDIPEIMDACIAKYKHKLLDKRGFAGISGTAVVVPPKKPRTLSEAKRLADELLGM